MATVEVNFLHSQLEKRKSRLEAALALAPFNTGLAGLLREVDSALDRMAAGSYGICEECHDTIEADRLLADPLIRYCLDHLTAKGRADLQRDLDLASRLQRRLLPPPGLSTASWQTSYHYEPAGPVSGDYCDLILSDGHLFFILGDVSGKGVAASMLMAQLHALFRSLIGLGLPLNQIIAQVNRVFCESVLAGLYATLVVGQASQTGEVEIHNAGHLPVIHAGSSNVQRLDSTSLPLGMFQDAEFSATRLQLKAGETLFLYTDGLSEARDHVRDIEDEYGVDRLAHLMRSHAALPPPELISACLKDVSAFTASSPYTDDLTLLAIRHTGSA
jgi:sigma-B regulation protein RsbU (phosphoserine phosphatase)